MARIFITGSSDGIGLRTAQRLIADGHQVVLHARNEQRAREALEACPGAEGVLLGDLSSIEETKRLAQEANALVCTLSDGSGHGSSPTPGFDCVIHNAGVYRGQDNAISRGSGYPRLFTINTLAPFVLAATMTPPRRLVFISSNMHRGGRPKLDTMPLGVTYSDSKLHNVMLAKAFARRWRGRIEASVSADPGWVPTKLGGRSAPDSLEDAVATYMSAALGTGEAEGAGATGKYFAKSRATSPQTVADDERLQEDLLTKLASLSGVALDG